MERLMITDLCTPLLPIAQVPGECAQVDPDTCSLWACGRAVAAPEQRQAVGGSLSRGSTGLCLTDRSLNPQSRPGAERHSGGGFGLPGRV